MASGAAIGRAWHALTAVVVALDALLLAWLVVAALSPGLVETAPQPWRTLATSGSVVAMTVALLLGAAAFGLLVRTRWPESSRLPFLLSAWCAISAIPLALAAYLPCTGTGPIVWDALSNAFAMFLGSYERPFGPGEACTYAVPLALQVARLLAIIATLTGATSVLVAVSRSQLDRLAVLRARTLIVVIGVDESSWPVVQRLARTTDRSARTVLLTSDPAGAVAERARSLGMLVLRTAPDDPLGVRDGFRWRRVTRCYLLSADAGANRARALQLRAAAPGITGARQRRLTVIARIDDPWHADDFRKRFIGDPGFVFDAIGRYEATAEDVVARVRTLPGRVHVLLVGEGPLALAVLAELSQVGRELEFLAEADALPQVRVLDPDAAALVADHLVRQQRFAVDPLVVAPVPGAVGLAELEEQVRLVLAEGGSPAVVIVTGATRLGTRLAVRHPELPVFELAAGDRPLPGDEPMAGRLVAFALALAPSDGRAADAWERAARAVHERYRRRHPEALLAVPWADLPEFHRESNRRQLSAILDGMVALGRTWAPATAEAGTPDPGRLASEDDAVRSAEGCRLFGLGAAELSALACAEHESWRSHHLAAGWEHGPVRDDARRRHPDLVPWPDLSEASRAKTGAGVIDTLLALRALGYRAVPVEGGWARYRRVGEVRASRLTGTHGWASGTGDALVGTAGDWLVEDPTGGRRTVSDEAFRATHRYEAGDRWARAAVVEARPAVAGEAVLSREGLVTAGPSSWVVRDAAGNRWIVADAHFRSGYVRE